MTDPSNVPIPPEPAGSTTVAPEAQPAGPSAGQAWNDVVTKLGELGDALTAWAKAAADTPENRRHLDEVRAGVNDMAREADDAFESVAESDFGRQVSQSAAQMGSAIGETAQEFGQAAAPHVANALAGLAGAFGRAAEKVGETVASAPAPEPRTAAAPEPSVPTRSPEDDTKE